MVLSDHDFEAAKAAQLHAAALMWGVDTKGGTAGSQPEGGWDVEVEL